MRLRLLGLLVGAALLVGAPLGVAQLIAVRDSIYAGHLEAARERLRAQAAAARAACSGEPDGAACLTRMARLGDSAGAPAPCAGPTGRQPDALLLCEPLGDGMPGLRARLPLGPIGAQLAALDLRLGTALLLSLLGLVLGAAWLLERAVVRPIAQVDEALGLLGPSGEGELLPEGGDALGRLGSSVNRLGQRLRESRARVEAQLRSLEQANGMLAQEKRSLQRARDELHRSERLASVGRLAAGVAHEVGNPITAVIAFAALLRDRLPESDPARGYAERIEREAARVDRILRDLLELARPGPARLEPVDLSSLLGSLPGSQLESVPGSPLELRIELQPGLPPVLAEPHYLAQVFVNLATNARRAGARSLRLTAEVEPEWVELAAADDGPGIAPEHLPRLFDPFFTTAAPGQGSGLGLAICHATMERFGGSIRVSAEPGQGAVFRLRLRRATEVSASG
jgi:signal transduction histidine kinase